MINLVVVAAHPDDEVLSMGALLCKAKYVNFIDITIIVMTDGRNGENSFSYDTEIRSKEFVKVSNYVKANHMCLYQYDRKIKCCNIIENIENHLKQMMPDMVVWPSGFSLNQHQDHIEVNSALINISSRWDYEKTCWVIGQPPVFVFSENEFRPNLFIGYDNKLMTEQKEIVSFYESESHKIYMKPDHIESRAKIWANNNRVNALYAEPYMLVKGFPLKEIFS